MSRSLDVSKTIHSRLRKSGFFCYDHGVNTCWERYGMVKNSTGRWVRACCRGEKRRIELP
jgi:hypothetical protein